MVFSAASGHGIALQDPDAGPLDPIWDLTLSVPAGTLTLATTAGLIGSGDGTGSLSYSGSLAAIDAALEGLTYTPPPGTIPRHRTQPGCDQSAARADPISGVRHVWSLRGHHDGRQRPGSLRQAILDSNAATGATNTIDFDIPGSGVQTIVPALGLARDHQPGADRRHLAAGLRRHAVDRAQRQPGRRRRRPDDHRLGRHRPRPGHRQLQPGCRHSHHGHRRHGRLDLRRLPGDRSDRHAGRAERLRRRDRRGGQQQPDRDQRRRHRRCGRAEPDLGQLRAPASGSTGQGTDGKRRGQLHRHEGHRGCRPGQRNLPLQRILPLL